MIAQVQEDYQADVQRQIANAKVVAQRSDELNDAFIQERAAQVEAGEFDEMDVDFKPPPVAEPKSKPPPAKPKWLGLLTAS